MDAKQNESRRRIIPLLSGQVACPIIASLAELGIVQNMLNESFSSSDFPEVQNQSLLEACFQYLESIWLATNWPELRGYVLTNLGQSVFTRSGAFLLLSSYREYFSSRRLLIIAWEANEKLPPFVPKAEVWIDERDCFSWEMDRIQVAEDGVEE